MRTLEDKIEYTLDKIRPFLRRDGGDIVIDHYDKKSGILYVDMIGACKGCYLAAEDITESVEAIVMNEVPQVTALRLVEGKGNPEFRSLTSQIRHPLREQLEDHKEN